MVVWGLRLKRSAHSARLGDMPMDVSTPLTFSFFDESCRDALRICGSKSGRQIDKCEATGLKPVRERDYVWFEQARLVLQCRILYKDDLKKSCFLDDSLLSNYQENDYHRMYVCEIEHVRKAVDDKS